VGPPRVMFDSKSWWRVQICGAGVQLVEGLRILCHRPVGRLSDLRCTGRAGEGCMEGGRSRGLGIPTVLAQFPIDFSFAGAPPLGISSIQKLRF
jgi:hypothetical protein